MDKNLKEELRVEARKLARVETKRQEKSYKSFQEHYIPEDYDELELDPWWWLLND